MCILWIRKDFCLIKGSVKRHGNIRLRAIREPCDSVGIWFSWNTFRNSSRSTLNRNYVDSVVWTLYWLTLSDFVYRWLSICVNDVYARDSLRALTWWRLFEDFKRMTACLLSIKNSSNCLPTIDKKDLLHENNLTEDYLIDPKLPANGIRLRFESRPDAKLTLILTCNLPNPKTESIWLVFRANSLIMFRNSALLPSEGVIWAFAPRLSRLRFIHCLTLELRIHRTSVCL